MKRVLRLTQINPSIANFRLIPDGNPCMSYLPWSSISECLWEVEIRKLFFCDIEIPIELIATMHEYKKHLDSFNEELEMVK